MMTQTEIANKLNISKTTVSYILNGGRKVSWPVAEKLSQIFPGRDVVGWKNATPEELEAALMTIGLVRRPNKRRGRQPSNKG